MGRVDKEFATKAKAKQVVLKIIMFNAINRLISLIKLINIGGLLYHNGVH